MGSTLIGRLAMRCKAEVTCAVVMRLRRSATSRAFATSRGQMAGVVASTPAPSRSSTPSVYGVLSSEKHHASATEASRTRRLVTAAFINQLANGQASQVGSFPNLADIADDLFQIFGLSIFGWNQLGHGNSAPRDADGFTLQNLAQQLIQVRLRFECAYCFHTTSLPTSRYGMQPASGAPSLRLPPGIRNLLALALRHYWIDRALAVSQVTRQLGTQQP